MKSNSNLMRAHWEEQVESYSRRRHPSPVDEYLVKLLSQLAAGPVLELGCGPGVLAHALAQSLPHLDYFGLDFAGNFIKAAKTQNHHASWVQADAMKLPFVSERFRAIFEMNTIHHFPKAKIPLTIQEAARVLRPEGFLILAEDWALFPENEREELAHRLQAQRYLTREGLESHPSETEWRVMMDTAGLHIVHRHIVDRPLDFNQFAELEDEQSLRDLQTLRHLWQKETPTTKMIILQAQKV